MTDLEVQCGGSGKGKEDWIVDCFLGWWWVMSGPHNALSRQNAAGADNLDIIIIREDSVIQNLYSIPLCRIMPMCP